MKFTLQYIKNVALLALLCAPAALAQASPEKIVVVGNHAPPFRIIDNGSYTGIYFDIMREIGIRLNVPVEYREVPFKRALREMETGLADIMLGPNRTAEREAYMVYTAANIGKANKAFYSISPENQVRTYDDLEDKNILVHRGKVYFQQFDDDDSLDKQVVSNYQSAIRLVQGARGDIVIMPEQEGDYLLNQMNINLIKSPYIVEGRHSYITISKQSQVRFIQDEIEAIFRDLEQSGIIDTILDQYRPASQ